MQLSNEGLTTEIGSYTEHLSSRANRSAVMALHAPQSRWAQLLAAMKIDRPKPVRWCSA